MRTRRNLTSHDFTLPPHQRGSRAGLVLSTAFHLTLIGLLWYGFANDILTGTAGPGSGDGGGGGGGGGRVHLLTLPPPPPRREAVLVEAPRPVPPPPVEIEAPVLPVEVVVVDTPIVAVPDSVELAAAAGAGGGAPGPGEGPGSGGGSGGGRGGGVGPGTGAGVGPGTGGGGSLARNPEPRQLLLPPEVKDKKLRGQTYAVTFWVRADGRVDRIRVIPELPDREYARKFRERMEGYLFRPARSPTGAAVSGTIKISVSL